MQYENYNYDSTLNIDSSYPAENASVLTVAQEILQIRLNQILRGRGNPVYLSP